MNRLLTIEFLGFCPKMNKLLCIPVIRGYTPNFELWHDFFLYGDMFPCEDSKTVSVCLFVCLTVCPYPEKRNPPGFVRQYQSYISNWYINGKVFMNTTPWIPYNLFFFLSKKVEIEFWLVLKCWNHPFFNNNSPTVVIGTWLESFSRLLQHRNPKKWFT